MSPVNLHFGNSGWKGLEAIKTQGGRRSLGGLRHPTFPGGPWGLTWGLGESECQEKIEGAVTPWADLPD